MTISLFNRAPEPTRIETKHFYAEPLGSSWVVRDKDRGEVVCFREDDKDAERAMEEMETNGHLGGVR
jgi:hypothetical protein